MRMYDLILKKRNGYELTKEEIEFLIDGCVKDEIPDYQMSAFLMAVFFNGMSKVETLYMTNSVANSGEIIDLSAIKGIKVDKHSTGGVGDKTTLVVAPIVAACGLKVAKMSGRGLGHTGGTVDKLEAIPNMQMTIDKEKFFEIVNKIGISVIGQSGNLAPADKKIYALRDVTATVDNISLIAVSIMSKKIAAGSDCILLDVKMGSGAFMKTLEQAKLLAQEMVEIGENAGKRTIALITNMDIPLGKNIGNSLEVIEAIQTLNGDGPEDLTEICIEIAANMLYMGEKGNLDQCYKLAKEAILSKSALNKLAEMVEAQGGDKSYIFDSNMFQKASIIYNLTAEKDGYICKMDTEGCGIASSLLGAGRQTKDSEIDHLSGIEILKKTGDFIKKGDIIAIMHTNDANLLKNAIEKYQESVIIGDEKPQKSSLIYDKIYKER